MTEASHAPLLERRQLSQQSWSTSTKIVNVPPLANGPLLSSADIIELSRVDAVINLQRWWKHRRRNNHKRIAELSEQLRAYAGALIQKKRQARIRAKIRDIFLHIVFLYFYTMSTHHRYSQEHLFRMISATTREYLSRGISSEAFIHERTFSGISSPSDLYAWLNGPFLSVSYPGYSSSSSPSIMLTNRVVGGIRIGQLRVEKSLCTSRASTYFSSLENETASALYCYGSDHGDFETGVESSETFSEFPFSGLNGTSTVVERDEWFSSTTTSNSRTFPAPAYSVVLPSGNLSTAREILQWMENNEYVDMQTRAVMIDVNLFNAMLRYVVVLRFLVEFPSGGGAIPMISVSSAPLTKSFLLSSDDTWWTVCNLFVVIFYSYFLVSEIALQTNRRRRKQLAALDSEKALRWSTRNGSVLRMISLGFYSCTWLMRLFTLMKFPDSFPLSSSSEYTRIRAYAEAFRVSQYLLGINTCFCWWIFLLLLRVVTHIDLFVRTIEIAATRLLTLLFCLALLLYSYSSAFLVAVGSESVRFSSIPQAMATLLLLLFGSSNVSSLTSYSTVEMFLFAAFLLLNVFIVSNFFLVIMFDAYRRALDDGDRLQNSNDQFDLPQETVKYLRAVWQEFVAKVTELWTKVKTKPKPVASTGDKLKRLSVVHAISNSRVVAQSKRLLAGQVGALSELSDKIARNVAAGLGEGDRDLLIEAEEPAPRKRSPTVDGYLSEKRRDGRSHGDQHTKLLQGMLLQLALQNENLHRSVEELRRELRQHGTSLLTPNGDGSAGGVAGGPTNRTASSTQLRPRTFALNQPENDDEDDGDGDEDVSVIESPTELTVIQSL